MFARRPRFNDSHCIAGMRLAFLVMNEKLRPTGHNPLVQGMRYAPAHLDDDRLLHLRPRHDADLLLAVPYFRRCRRVAGFLYHVLPISKRLSSRLYLPDPRSYHARAAFRVAE